ncbi:MAG: ABC transporter [Sphingomonadaceae bacterium]|nr:ABC transporter [Sphingomonadaceae bacterium]
MRQRSNAFLLAGMVAVALASCGTPEPPRPEGVTIGLVTSLPIYWPESDDPADLLAQSGNLPWPRTLIERHYALVPLDTLAPDDGLGQVDALVLAQPRPLSPVENVALDSWVRDGGHVLVFADPMLTGESRFHIGDRRRPQDVILLSPILARWGLDLQFDDSQPDEVRMIRDADQGSLPVRLAGRLVSRRDGGAGAVSCRTAGEAVIARCRVGAGTVTVIADAALLETAEDGAQADREAAFGRLVDDLARAATGQVGENTGRRLVKADSDAVVGARDGTGGHD